ncbi:MAG: thioredoxin domain-containing protein [Chlorobi bacterium]|nr:thioredoxin domain-containing protein [Chlorobiota bacterium]
MNTEKKKANHLISEKSPYLLQHAYNPVDWYPWGEEAFAKAKAEDKPIFLSIGYSTCHWCHVMERESFEDSSVAEIMNKYFVAIKVDREERPDIDNIYMTVSQMLNGSGGWPLTIIMTPDKKPFFAGTYIPKESRGNRIGLIDLLERIDQLWQTEREKIDGSADEISLHLENAYSSSGVVSLDGSILDEAFDNFNAKFDAQFGGFGNAPKFPSPHNLMFLLRYWKSSGNEKSLKMVEKTLTEMRKGGIFDRVGFGFHRYSTDREWTLPHFEKMLYDQAMLASAYTELFQITKNNDFKKTAEEIFTYVLRDMTSPEGGFFSAEDADSDGEEGKFYVWTAQEIDRLLPSEDSEIFKFYFNVKKAGNFRDEAARKPTGNNILYVGKSVSETADSFGKTEEEITGALERSREIIFKAREKRIHPSKDDKILTDWNGLMISALAKAGKIFDEPKYIQAAERCASFISGKLTNENGSILHRYREGEAAIDGYIDDYAFLAQGLTELYEATFELNYLIRAKELTDFAIANFWDEENGGFFFTRNNGEKLPARSKDFYDGAIPSGNSVMLLNLIKTGRFTAKEKYETYADKLVGAFSASVKRNPTAYGQFLSGFDFLANQSFEIIIVAEQNDDRVRQISKVLESVFVPNKVALFLPTGEKETVNSFAPFTKDYETLNDKPTIYVCRNYSCALPTNDAEKMLELLKQ